MYQQIQSSPYLFHNHSHQPMSSVSGVQGQLLEITVVGCSKLRDTEWISRQDPYVCVEYGGNKSRTRTCTDGGRNPTFQEKFVFTLIEGLREMIVLVWNSNTLTTDDFIGSGKVQLHKVLSQGYDDSTWPLQTKTGRYAGEVRVIMHYANANKPATTYSPSAPPYGTHVPQTLPYSAPPSATYGQPAPAYPPAYPYPSYPTTSAYPQSAYPPPHQPTAYPPHPYPQPSAYPPPPYPPPPHASPYPPPGPFPGLYPPPPY